MGDSGGFPATLVANGGGGGGHDDDNDNDPESTTMTSSSSSSSSNHHNNRDDNRSRSSTWVKLNIGGTVFTTTKTTLAKDPDSFLARLSSGSVSSSNSSRDSLGSDRDGEGAFLIDRDPHYFGPVLNFLRHGKLVMDQDLSEEGVLEEAEFYNVKNLIHLVKERIKMRDDNPHSYLGRFRGSSKNGSAAPQRQNVYRVLECFECELTNMVSTLSDGWRFEQLIKMEGPRYNSSDNTDPVFLCVVSKSFDAPPPPSSHRNHSASASASGDADAKQPKDRAQFLQQLGSRMKPL